MDGLTLEPASGDSGNGDAALASAGVVADVDVVADVVIDVVVDDVVVDAEAALPPTDTHASAEAHNDGTAHSPWPHRVDTGWQCLSTAANAYASPADLPADGWLEAQVPGTVAGARTAAGLFDPAQPSPLAFDDHWYRVTLRGTGLRRLRFHGLATICEVWVDGIRRLDSDSMFIAHDMDIELNGSVVLALCFRSLTPALAEKRPRARWRPRLAQPPTLRNVRTTLLGHMPGWCAPIHAVGPWRPVELLSDAAHAFDTIDLTSRIEGDDGSQNADADGLVSLTLRFVKPHALDCRATLVCGDAVSSLQWLDAYTLSGSVRVPRVRRWWPHTHGTPTLYPLTLQLDDADASKPSHVNPHTKAHADPQRKRQRKQTSYDLGPIGFRTLDVDRGADGAGFAIRVNGVPLFCRGACWTSADLVTLAGSEAALHHAFALARDAGMNMLRVGGTMLYESDAFYRLADTYGVLIWQDFALANFDYPDDTAFQTSVETEATQFLARTRRYAALAVLCGGSEADQQAAMFGLPAARREQAVFTRYLPALVARERPDVPYVGNTPCGGAWPFSTNEGVTHYYGVGAYQRPLDDVRRAQVRFAAECLAFANVPDDRTLDDALGTRQPHDPRWKAAVPRDPGAGWDFDDVRDHYLRTLYGVEPQRLRYEDNERYLDLSRAVVAELMNDVFAEWRRAGSTCGGALVWQLQDLRAGGGWGVIDSAGRPKSALHGLAHALQPVQALFTDEGLNGLDIHLINEGSQTMRAQLELLCLRDGHVKVASASCALELAARSVQRVSAAACLGQFFDFTHAYRFGPRAHDVTIATLRDADSGEIVSETFHLPERRVGEPHDLGLTVALERARDGWQLVIEAQRFARFVHIVDPHYRARHDWFHLAPNRPRIVPLIASPQPAGRSVTPDLGPANGESVFKADATYPAPAGEVRAINAISSIYYR